jgi:tRNA A-37 threonylcarbamoyl transferase component Bud32
VSLNPSITLPQLADFLNSARKRDSDCTPEVASELRKLSSHPPSGWAILKNGSRSKVGSHILADGQRGILKYYDPKNVFKKLNYRINGSRCLNSWVAGLALNQPGISTPQPPCIRETTEMAGLLNARSFLANRQFEGVAISALPVERLRNVAEQLGRAFELFDGYHISHGDLKASKILVDEHDRISFIDLDATRFLLDGSECANARRNDRERFLRNWDDRPEATALLNPCFP